MVLEMEWLNGWSLPYTYKSLSTKQKNSYVVPGVKIGPLQSLYVAPVFTGDNPPYRIRRLKRNNTSYSYQNVFHTAVFPRILYTYKYTFGAI